MRCITLLVVASMCCVALELRTASADPITPIDWVKHAARERRAQQPKDARKALASVWPEVRLDEVPLSDVLDFYRGVTDSNIFVDWVGLSIDKTAPVSFRLYNRPLSELLAVTFARIKCDRGEIAFETDDEVIYISTRERLRQIRDFQRRQQDRPLGDKERETLARRFLISGVDICTSAQVGGLRLDAEPFENALTKMAEQIGVAITADWDGLAQLGIDRRTPVGVEMKNVTLATALTALLANLGDLDRLDFEVEEQQIRITVRQRQASDD